MIYILSENEKTNETSDHSIFQNIVRSESSISPSWKKGGLSRGGAPNTGGKGRLSRGGAPNAGRKEGLTRGCALVAGGKGGLNRGDAPNA